MLSLTRADARQLSNLSSTAILTVLTKGGTKTSVPTGEVSAVKSVVLDGFDMIAMSWMPILRSLGYQLNLSAVFTHGRPHVVSSAGTCELADLLIVVDDVVASTVRDRRAVLVQAKVLKQGQIKLRGREKVQFDLMSVWPSFKFKDATYDTRSRDFHDPNAPGAPDNAGEYGGIELGGLQREWTQYLMGSQYGFTAAHPLGDYLVQMLEGRNYYGREAIPHGSDDWSFTVDELMRVTAANFVTKKSAYHRGNTHQIRFMGVPTSQLQLLTQELLAPEYVAGGEGLARPPEADDETWGEGPLSVVHLELQTEI